MYIYAMVNCQSNYSNIVEHENDSIQQFKSVSKDTFMDKFSMNACSLELSWKNISLWVVATDV